MAYRIKLTDEAMRVLPELTGNVRQRIRRLIGALAAEPRPVGAKELRGLPGIFRQRLARWRVIYRVVDEERLVIVLSVRAIIVGPSA